MQRSSLAVHILTGFLGSGKTTILNRALTSGLGAETAVVINEFGEIALDQHFIAKDSEEVLVLKSGCVCCSVRTDLVATLMQLAAGLADGSYTFNQIIIETSGLSDPIPILITLSSNFNLLTRFHIGRVVCAVDTTAEPQARMRLELLRQIAAADICVTTKGDLAAPGDIDRTKAWIRTINPIATIEPSDEIDLATGLKVSTRIDSLDDRIAHIEAAVPAAERDHSVRSLVLRTSASASWPRFAVWLSALIFVHGDRILRLKGIVRDHERGAWIGVHGVRRFLYPPEHLDADDLAPSEACLVFITDGLDPALIAQSYQRAVVQEADDPDNDRSGALPDPYPEHPALA
jgi:G3E family GTPase